MQCTRSFSSGPAHEARSAAAPCWTAPCLCSSVRCLPRSATKRYEGAGVAGGRRPLSAASLPRELARMPFGHTSHKAQCGTLDWIFVHRATHETGASPYISWKATHIALACGGSAAASHVTLASRNLNLRSSRSRAAVRSVQRPWRSAGRASSYAEAAMKTACNARGASAPGQRTRRGRLQRLVGQRLSASRLSEPFVSLDAFHTAEPLVPKHGEHQDRMLPLAPRDGAERATWTRCSKRTSPVHATCASGDRGARGSTESFTLKCL